MSKEIEIKVLGIKKAPLVKKLRELGATRKFSGLVICRHFDFADKRLRKGGKLIRVRSMGKSKVEFTYKGPKQNKGGMKIRPEIETYVEDGAIVAGILKEAGLKETLYCEKKRTSYRFGEVVVDIDEYPGGIVYAEVEGPSAELVKRAVRRLGLEDFEMSSETASRLFEKWGMKLDGMRF